MISNSDVYERSVEYQNLFEYGWPMDKSMMLNFHRVILHLTCIRAADKELFSVLADLTEFKPLIVNKQLGIFASN